MIEASPGGGYEVDATVLRSFAQTAHVAGQGVEVVAGQVQAALSLGASGGLDIGAAMVRAGGAWSARLAQLAGQAAAIASTLTANATSYEQTEAAILRSLTGPGL